MKQLHLYYGTNNFKSIKKKKSKIFIEEEIVNFLKFLNNNNYINGTDYKILLYRFKTFLNEKKDIHIRTIANLNGLLSLFKEYEMYYKLYLSQNYSRQYKHQLKNIIKGLCKCGKPSKLGKIICKDCSNKAKEKYAQLKELKQLEEKIKKQKHNETTTRIQK